MTKRKRVSKKAEAGSGDITVGTGDVVFGSKTTVSQGDYVGRDKIVTGLKGDELSHLFAPLLAAVRQQAPADKQAEAEQKVAQLQQQVKAKTPDIGLVGKALKWLKSNVPGVSGALSAALHQPVIGQGIKDIAAVILEDES